MFWETFWALVLGFGISGAVQAFVPRRQIEGALGSRSPKAVARATFLGMVSSSCSYAAGAMAKSLFAKGADFAVAMIFMLASTNLVIELGIVLWLLIGWQFTASELVGGLVMIAMFTLVARWFFPSQILQAARARFGQESGEHHHHSSAETSSSPKNLAGWADAAGFTIADIKMVRRELLIGFVVAGLLATLIPETWWQSFFFSGHGVATSLENAVVGPFIAVISFVCSIGNVPLAAALWKGGISFGGVVAFIFSDLITFPLLMIYRKYYGRNLTLRLLAAFWLVMSLGGLATEALFGAAGWIPTVRSDQIVAQPISLNYTTALNILAVLALATMYALTRNATRWGGGTGYATDPVCGMQVRIDSAPASDTDGDRPFYFCSDGCHDHWAHQK